jgi:prolycopene isomerase
VEWECINEAFNSINLDPLTGFAVSKPVGEKAFVYEMERQFPCCRSSMETVMELARMVQDGVEWLGKYHNEPTPPAKIMMMLKWRDFMKVFPVTTDEMLRRIGVPDKAREIFESYWDYAAVDSTKMSFAVYIYMTYTYLTKKPWIGKLRSHGISMAFDNRIREMGGDIRYNTEVTRIDVQNNRVKGVELASGEYIPCERVISNVMPTVVFSKMVDPKEVPDRDRRLMNARKLAQSAFTVYLGLDASAEELGLKGYDTFVRTSGDTLAQYTANASIETHKNYGVTVLNNVIPDASPAGTCFLQFTKLYTEDAFADVTEENYFQIKDRIAEETITHFEKLTGINVRDHIEEIEIATPVTWARYLGTPQGDVYGYAPGTWDGMLPRMLAGHRLDYTIHGLRFCGGHGTQMDGYSQAYLSGAEQARYTLLDMKEGK